MKPSRGLLFLSRFHRGDEFEELDDPGVIDGRQTLGLLRQRHQPAAAGGIVGTRDLDGHFPATLFMNRQEDQEVAPAQQTNGLIPADPFRHDNVAPAVRFLTNVEADSRRRRGRGRLIEVLLRVRFRPGVGGRKVRDRGFLARLRLAQNGMDQNLLPREAAFVIARIGRFPRTASAARFRGPEARAAARKEIRGSSR